MSMQDAASAANDTGSADEERTRDHQVDPPDREGFARRMGWVPEEEWSESENKKPRRFLSADEYIDKTMTTVPVLRERLRFYDEKLLNSTGKIDELTGTISEQGQLLKDLWQKTTDAERRGYERAVVEKQEEMRAAVASADTASFAKAEAELADLQKQAPTPAPAVKPANAPQTQTIHPDVQQWVSANPWYLKDAVLNAAATVEHGKVTAEMPGASEAERLAETERRVRAEFPQRFGINPRRDAPAAVGSSSGEVRNKGKGKTVADLPTEAKEMLGRLKKLSGMTEEEYLKTYPW